VHAGVVRFTREVSGTSELMVTSRGAKEEIDVFPGFPLDNELAGNVVDLCPVGALGDEGFPLPAAGVVSEAGGERLRRLRGRLLDLHRAESRHRLTGSSPARTCT